MFLLFAAIYNLPKIYFILSFLDSAFFSAFLSFAKSYKLLV